MFSIDDSCQCVRWDQCKWAVENDRKEKALSLDNDELNVLKSAYIRHACGEGDKEEKTGRKVFCCGPDQQPPPELEIRTLSLFDIEKPFSFGR